MAKTEIKLISEEFPPTKYLHYDDFATGDVLVRGTFKRQHEGEYGLTYYFKSEDGEDVGLNGKGHLDKLIRKAELKPGDWVEIVYGGKSAMKGGEHKGTQAHQFHLYKDDEKNDCDQPF